MSLPRPAATLLTLLFAVCLTAGPPARADDRKPAEQATDKRYPIKFVRPVTVGTKYHYVADGAILQRMKMTVGGKPGRSSEDGHGIHVEGTVEVLAVNDEGEEAKVACKLDKCVRMTGEDEKELIPAGRVVTAVAGKEKTTFTLDEGAISKEAEEALDLVLRLPEDDGYTDDDVYGTKEPQKVGASWPVNAEAMAKSAEDEDVKVDPKDVGGSLKLEAIETVEGVECLKISGSLSVKRLIPKAPEGLPPGTKVVNGSMDARFSGLFPTDLSKGSLSESMSMVMSNTLKREADDQGPEFVIETTLQRAVEMKRKFLDGTGVDAKGQEPE